MASRLLREVNSISCNAMIDLLVSGSAVNSGEANTSWAAGEWLVSTGVMSKAAN